MSEPSQSEGRPSRGGPPFWRDVRVLRIGFQAAFVLAIVALAAYLYNNLIQNLAELGLGTSFSYLQQSTNFDLAHSDVDSSSSMLDALIVGVQNTIQVSAIGIVLATILGLLIGIGRLSDNWLVRKLATVYVEFFRNIPVLVIIVLGYFWLFIEQMPPIDKAIVVDNVLIVSVRGVLVPWVEGTGANPLVFLVFVVAGVAAAIGVGVWRTRRSLAEGRPSHRVLWALGALLAALVVGYLVGGRPFAISLPELVDQETRGGLYFSPEFSALLIGLVLYTASHIAEIVRASVLAVPRGQTEAADALALSPSQRMRLVVLPQAMRIMVPPLTNQYLNLLKNSSLGAAVAFPELSRITYIMIGQHAPAFQATLVQMGFYLALCLLISLLTNLVNSRLALRGGRR